MCLLSGLFRELNRHINVVDSVELFVASRLKSALDLTDYRVVNNVLLPSLGNTSTTQIDHIVFSIYGIFVIETKSHQGWIFGSRSSKQWTQVLYRSKYRLNNPIHQNYAHIRAIEDILSSKLKVKPISLIVFPSADKIVIDDTQDVGSMPYIIRRILSCKTKVYTHRQVADIIQLVSQYNNQAPEEHRQHKKEVEAYLHAL